MEHLESGALRAFLDEPQALASAQRDHLAGCSACRTHLAEITANAQAAAGAFEATDAVDESAALLRVRAGAAQRTQPRFAYTFGAGLAAAGFLAALIFTPLGGYARSFLTIFEPRAFEPVRISGAQLHDLHLLPQADRIGTQRIVLRPSHVHVNSLAAARARLDFAPVTPARLPADLQITPGYAVTGPGEMTFTFSAAKARAFEAGSHKLLPPMPPGLDGTTVRLRMGMTFNVRYAGSGGRFVELVETHVPKITSSGASLSDARALHFSHAERPAGTCRADSRARRYSEYGPGSCSYRQTVGTARSRARRAGPGHR